MVRRVDLRSLLIAVAFFAIGFLVADRMSRVEASAPAAQEAAAPSFSGADGAVVMKVNGVPNLVIVRGTKVWKIDPTGSGHARSFMTFGE